MNAAACLPEDPGVPSAGEIHPAARRATDLQVPEPTIRCSPESRVRLPRARIFLPGVVTLALAACATTGSTLGSGVGDRMIDDPPYYAGTKAAPSGRIVHLPISYQRGASQSPVLDPEARPGSPIPALLVLCCQSLFSFGDLVENLLVERGSDILKSFGITPPISAT
jgi:hypothetical protein